MSLRGLVQRVFRLDSVAMPTFTKDTDPDFGEFTRDGITSSWFIHRQTEGARIMIRGRSQAPTPEQKRLIDHFMPLLEPLTESSLAILRPPHDFPDHPIPSRLELRELRFESTGVAELFFDPQIEIDGYTLWPMATCSLDGRLLSTEWTT